MSEVEALMKKIDPTKMPRHVGIIMDGNGRWAKKHFVKRLTGHIRGRETVREIITAADDIGLECLTIYAFSTENWKRSALEVKGLMKLNIDSIEQNIDELHRKNSRVQYIGSRIKIDQAYLKRLDDITRKTWNNTGMKFNIAFNYGGRQEIIEAINQIVQDHREGGIPEITEEMIDQHLYTKGLPEPDLIIRTSGELRLSNFLLWQSAYSELWFTDTLWPDFTAKEFLDAILDFQQRNRKFGARK